MTSETGKRREEFAERVSRSLEAGVIPWQRKDLPDMPLQNAVSGRNYGGLNALYLMEKCAEKGYTDPRFITASEANKNGLHVRKGEHGTVLEYWAEGSDGKIKPHGYSVFNVQQLNGRLPIPEKDKPNLEHAAQMLKNAGIEIKPGSGVKEYQDAIKKLTVKKAEEMGLKLAVHTPELLALRYSIASTMAMREAGIPVEQTEGTPAKSWANSIKHDPAQLSKAVKDGSVMAEAVMNDMKNMKKSRDAELFRANQERAEAQRVQELAAEAHTIPRGLDSNLPNADLSGVQEAVIEAADKAATQVNDLRASASAREANAVVHEAGTGIDKIAAARNVAKKELGDNVIVTSAQPGHTYQGKIIGILGGLTSPDKSAVQAVSDNHAILHDIRNLSAESNLKVGEEITLAADEQGYSAVQGRDAKSASKKEEQKREGHKR